MNTRPRRESTMQSRKSSQSKMLVETSNTSERQLRSRTRAAMAPARGAMEPIPEEKEKPKAQKKASSNRKPASTNIETKENRPVASKVKSKSKTKKSQTIAVDGKVEVTKAFIAEPTSSVGISKPIAAVVEDEESIILEDLPFDINATFLSNDDDSRIIIEDSITKKAKELMMAETASESYWKMISLQRENAIEKTSMENELLRDKIVDLAAENMQLSRAVKAAEDLAQAFSVLE